MIRFSSSTRCPNCGGFNTSEEKRCWGIAYEKTFLCTSTANQGRALETDWGYLHYHKGCNCRLPHDGGNGEDYTVMYNEQNFKPRKKNHDPYINTLWRESNDIKGTIAHSYLLRRNIEITSDALRFHPNISHPGGEYYPAVLCKISDMFNKMIGLQRIYLTSRGEKINKKPTKAIVGNLKGGSVKLAPLNENGVLGIAEGIETALSVTQALGIPVWATLGSSNMHSIGLPPPSIIHTIKIYADNDDNEVGLNAMYKAGDVFTAEGYTVYSVPFPKHLNGSDYNDLLKNTD